MQAFGWHLLSFLSGVALGAAGTYYAEKFTDARRSQEARKATRAQFVRLQALMPRLFAEMRDDVEGDKTGLVREFVVLPSKGVMFNSSKARFSYYEKEHEELLEKLSHLEQVKFIVDVSPGNTPVYRMDEAFVSLLARSR